MTRIIPLIISIMVMIPVCLSGCGKTAGDEKTAPGDENTGLTTDEIPVELHDGATLVKERCTVCHSAEKVYGEKADKEKWTKIIDRMIKKGAELDDTEKDVLITYLSEGK